MKDEEILDCIDYIQMWSKKELIRALKWNDHNGDYDGISRTVAAFSVLRVAIENEMSYEDVKTWLKTGGN